MSQFKYEEAKALTSSRSNYVLYLSLASIAVITIADLLMLPILKHFTDRDISLLEFFLMLPRTEQRSCYSNCERFAKAFTIGDTERPEDRDKEPKLEIGEMKFAETKKDNGGPQIEKDGSEANLLLDPREECKADDNPSYFVDQEEHLKTKMG